jgi:uncharacterized metal-binding protein
MQWIVVNLFLLLLIGVGAGTFFVLGSGVKAMNLDSDVEPYFLAVVAVASIFASYYTGKFLHDLADGCYRRKK